MMTALRRDLHRHPEISGEERHTAERVARALTESGLAVRGGVGGFGIVVDIPGHAGVSAVLLRADMDALPIHEETGLPFASERPGVMHACGHDGHMAMLVGTARLLADRAPLPAPVRIIFQPAEETGTGAAAMIGAGVLEGVAIAFGGHIDRTFDVGTIAIADGTVNASCDDFAVSVTARGGHAARPHETVDPIVVGSRIVSALQVAVARETDPQEPAVVTVGAFHAGTAPNVIASEARLEGTVRALRPEVREQLIAAVTRLVEATAAAHGTSARLEWFGSTPAVINAEDATALARRAATAAVGAGGVRELAQRSMGAEDFGYYCEHVPTCFVRLGARPPDPSYPAHSPRFDFDERVLSIGAAYFAEVALEAGRGLAAPGSV